MAVTTTYPGVYIQEIPSAARTISGVATAITAFVGRTQRGPISEPVTINNFSDFERRFGGLWLDGPMSYAVRDYFLNGGGQAIIVRLYKEGDTDGYARATLATAADESATIKVLSLIAASPGQWGNSLLITVDTNGIDDEVAARYGLAADALFNLSVSYNGTTERFANVSVVEGARRVDRVLAQSSALIRVDGTLPEATPTATDEPVAAADGVVVLAALDVVAAVTAVDVVVAGVALDDVVARVAVDGVVALAAGDLVAAVAA